MEPDLRRSHSELRGFQPRKRRVDASKSMEKENKQQTSGRERTEAGNGGNGDGDGVGDGRKRGQVQAEPVTLFICGLAAVLGIAKIRRMQGQHEISRISLNNSASTQPISMRVGSSDSEPSCSQAG